LAKAVMLSDYALARQSDLRCATPTTRDHAKPPSGGFFIAAGPKALYNLRLHYFNPGK